MGEIKFIRKRDGRVVDFNIDKITDAIFKAASVLGGKDREVAEDLAYKVVDYLVEQYPGSIPTVEQTQDAVEKIMIENGHARTAKEFILYRAERTKVRESNTRLMRIYEDLTFKEAKENDIKRENANIDGNTAMGTMLKYGSEGAKEFYKMKVLNPTHSAAHENGDIHIHDMDFLTLTMTCCQIDLVKLLKGGFSTGHGHLREPNSIESYAALACIAIQSNQNDQHGGQSVPNFDYALAEGVRKSYKRAYWDNLGKMLESMYDIDEGEVKAREIGRSISERYGLVPEMKMKDEYVSIEREELLSYISNEEAAKIQRIAKKFADREIERKTYQAMEALIHNLNTMHSRAGAQVPFSSINYGTDTSPEGRLVMRCIMLATEAGLGHGETPIFPIQIFKVKEGISYNPGDPNYDLFKLACRTSAKRLFPNFSFLDAPYNIQYYKEGDYNTEVAYMGCRTRVIANVHDPSREIVTGRGNLSFTSVNLPRLAIKANGNLDTFFEGLDSMIDLCISQLLDRFRIQSRKKAKNFPFLMGQGVWIDSEKLKPDDSIEEVIKHGTLTMGFIGLAECLKALLGVHHGESPEAQTLGLEIIGYMRKRMDDEARKTGLNWSLIATPAEGLSGRFVKIDREKYGVIPGVTDRDYYTNSFHIPVYYEINAFDKIKLEAPYHALTNGGHISYIELDGDPLKNLDAFEKIVRCMKESGVGYGSINHPVDRDPVCGFTGIIDNECPHCGRSEDDGGEHFERIRRITGYLVGTMDNWNDAKACEEYDRVKHSLTGGSIDKRQIEELESVESADPVEPLRADEPIAVIFDDTEKAAQAPEAEAELEPTAEAAPETEAVSEPEAEGAAVPETVIVNEPIAKEIEIAEDEKISFPESPFEADDEAEGEEQEQEAATDDLEEKQLEAAAELFEEEPSEEADAEDEVIDEADLEEIRLEADEDEVIAEAEAADEIEDPEVSADEIEEAEELADEIPAGETADEIDEPEELDDELEMEAAEAAKELADDLDKQAAAAEEMAADMYKQASAAEEELQTDGPAEIIDDLSAEPAEEVTEMPEVEAAAEIPEAAVEEEPEAAPEPEVEAAPAIEFEPAPIEEPTPAPTEEPAPAAAPAPKKAVSAPGIKPVFPVPFEGFAKPEEEPSAPKEEFSIKWENDVPSAGKITLDMEPADPDKDEIDMELEALNRILEEDLDDIEEIDEVSLGKISFD